MTDWREIYDYWFGAPGADGHGDVREFWFGGGPSVDSEIQERFGGHYERACAGEFESWNSEARSAVSLIVLLDQFPRNIFRGDPRSFAADSLALGCARQLVDGPLHGDLITVEKVFAYLPFEHSENIEDQKKCVSLYEALEPHASKAEWIDFAVQHLDIIEEFGRFPHRNDILGRMSTPAEETWLATSEHRFGTGGDTDAQ
jgi:uncharacterized protein (DUF924 family)